MRRDLARLDHGEGSAPRGSCRAVPANHEEGLTTGIGGGAWPTVSPRFPSHLAYMAKDEFTGRDSSPKPVLLKQRPNQGQRTILPLFSANQGNVYSLLKESAKKPITAIIAMGHVKRDYHQWADDVAHLDFTSFSEDKRLDLSQVLHGFRLVPFLTDTTFDFTHRSARVLVARGRIWVRSA